MKMLLAFLCFVCACAYGQNLVSVNSESYNYAKNPVPDFVPKIFKEAPVNDGFQYATALNGVPFASARKDDRIHIIQRVVMSGDSGFVRIVYMYLDIHEPSVIGCMTWIRNNQNKTIANAQYYLKGMPYDKCEKYRVIAGVARRAYSSDCDLLPIPENPVQYFKEDFGIDLLEDKNIVIKN